MSMMCNDDPVDQTLARLRRFGGAPLASGIWPMPNHDRSKPYERFHLSTRPKVLDGDE